MTAKWNEITSINLGNETGDHLSHHVDSFDNNLVDLPQHCDDCPLLTHLSTLYHLNKIVRSRLSGLISLLPNLKFIKRPNLYSITLHNVPVRCFVRRLELLSWFNHFLSNIASPIGHHKRRIHGVCSTGLERYSLIQCNYLSEASKSFFHLSDYFSFCLLNSWHTTHLGLGLCRPSIISRYIGDGKLYRNSL